MSIATVVTRGYGSFGSVNMLPTLGYSISAAATLVYGPVKVKAAVRELGMQSGSVRELGASESQVEVTGARRVQ